MYGMRMRLIRYIVVAFGLFAQGQGSIAADIAPNEAEAVVQQLVSDVESSLRLPEGSPRLDSMTAAIEQSTNIPLLSRLALGRSWKSMSERQRLDYQELFRLAILGTLARRLELYLRDIKGSIEERFIIFGSEPVGRKDALVRSEVRTETGPPLVVNWRLRDGAIIDLVVEGVSLLISQRSEFAAVIERSTIDGLIDELRRRADR